MSLTVKQLIFMLALVKKQLTSVEKSDKIHFAADKREQLNRKNILTKEKSHDKISFTVTAKIKLKK